MFAFEGVALGSYEVLVEAESFPRSTCAGRRDIWHGAGPKDKAPSVTVGIDLFNGLNRVNYGSYVGNLSSPFFGLPASARPARRVQVSLRGSF
jgi:hypothetical protein